ncbi:MAG: NAD-dependent epimerase/dehydratase family protein [Planctomycetia bacterium]
MRRVLVTGAGGFIGRELVSSLARSGYSGVATGRQPPETVPPGWEAARRENVLDGSHPIEAIDVIVHLEVKHHVLRADADTLSEMHAVNVGGTNAWLDWASARNIGRFVFTSSVKAVRAGVAETFETAAPEALDAYGRSKAIAEAAVRGWAEAVAGRAAVILRLAPVYGPGNTANLASFARQVLRGRPCFVGAGATRKSVVSLRNAVAAIEWSLKNCTPGCDVFNVSDRTARSIAELANLIATAARAPRPRGIPIMIARLGAVAGDVAESILRRPAILDSRRLAAMLETTVFPPDKLLARGFVHPQETENGIAELVAWLTESSSPPSPGEELQVGT